MFGARAVLGWMLMPSSLKKSVTSAILVTRLAAFLLAMGPSPVHLAGGDVAAEIRRRVLDETRLTCSCGVAPNRMLAKVCSDVNKPNGQCVIPADPQEIRRFVDSLPIRKVPGVGKVGSLQGLLYARLTWEM